MAENKLADFSTEFAVQILKLTYSIKGHYSLANQLERSGTSIGANIREAKYAHGKADFIAKLQISLKECYFLLRRLVFFGTFLTAPFLWYYSKLDRGSFLRV